MLGETCCVLEVRHTPPLGMPWGINPPAPPDVWITGGDLHEAALDHYRYWKTYRYELPCGTYLLDISSLWNRGTNVRVDLQPNSVSRVTTRDPWLPVRRVITRVDTRAQAD